MSRDLTIEQKKEWAKLIFLKEDVTQQEIADKVGVTRITINKWCKEWEHLKINMLQTREECINMTLTYLKNLDETINKRDPAERFPTAKEADTRRKLTSDLEALEQEVGVRDIYNVFRGFLEWLRDADLNKAKELSDYCDAYIKEKMKS